MNIFDLNRFAAAVLGSILFVIVLIVIGNFIFEVDELKQNAYGEIETTAPEATVETGAVSGAGDEGGNVVSLAALLAQGSVEAGQRTAKRCAACHTFEKGVGRKKADADAAKLRGSCGTPDPDDHGHPANIGKRFSR